MQVERDGTRCPEEKAYPVGMPDPSQMFYGNHSKFGKRSSSVQSLISRGLIVIVYGQATECYLTFVRGKLHIFDKNPVSTIKLPQ